MSRADRLADRLASGWPELEDINAAVPELRRLSAVEAELEALKKAISDAEPVAWYDEDLDTAYSVGDMEGSKVHGLFPLYTLKGIK